MFQIILKLLTCLFRGDTSDSVPYGLLKRHIEAHVSEKTVKLHYQNQCVAQHLRSHRQGGYSTQVEHMPKAHQDYATWTPERLTQWAGKLGEYVLQWVKYKLASKTHPQQSYKVCFGLLSLSTVSYTHLRAHET